MRVLTGCFVNPMPFVVLLLIFLCSAPDPLLADEQGKYSTKEEHDTDDGTWLGPYTDDNLMENYLGFRFLFLVLNQSTQPTIFDKRYVDKDQDLPFVFGLVGAYERDVTPYLALGGEFGFIALDYDKTRRDNFSLEMGPSLRLYLPSNWIEPYLRLSGGFAAVIPLRSGMDSRKTWLFDSDTNTDETEEALTRVPLHVNHGYGGYNTVGLGSLFRTVDGGYFLEVGFHGLYYSQEWLLYGHRSKANNVEHVHSMMIAFGYDIIL